MSDLTVAQGIDVINWLSENDPDDSTGVRTAVMETVTMALVTGNGDVIRPLMDAGMTACILVLTGHAEDAKRLYPEGASRFIDPEAISMMEKNVELVTLEKILGA